MTIGLTVLLGLLSAGILAGRVYEILKLTDTQTGFFLYKGIVFSPYILIIFAIITVCCGIIIFGDRRNEQPFFSQSSKIIAVAAGAMFLIYGVMAVNSTAIAPFTVIGALAMLIIGTAGLKPKADAVNIAAVVLTVIFIVGLCLDVIVFNVSTIYNIEFTKNALSYIAAALFLMCVMKNVYRPGAKSKMLLYVTGMLAFLFCGVMNIADIIAMAVKGKAVLPDLFFHAGFGFLGFFALDNAISVTSARKSVTDSAQTPEAETDLQIPAEETDTDTAQEISPDSKLEEDFEENIKTIFKADSAGQQEYAEEKAYTFKAEQSSEKTEEMPAGKVVFSKGGFYQKEPAAKDSRKVVYKKPKN